MKSFHSKYGFDFTNLKLEYKPWISWLLLPSLYMMTVYVFFKKMYFMKFFGKVPSVNTIFFDGFGMYAKKVASSPGSWQTLKMIYNPPEEKSFTLSWIIDTLGFINTNCQAVRNRLRLAKSISRQIINKDHPKKVLCLACGSAESILPEFLSKNGNNCSSLTLVDNCCDAVNYLNDKLKDSSCKDKVIVVHKTVGEFLESSNNLKEYDLVEMVGLLEYVDDGTAFQILKGVNKIMSKGAFFIASNIKQNIETPFVKWVINWKMIYRTKEQIAKLTKDAGFDDFEIITEPLGIHNIVVVRKS